MSENKENIVNEDNDFADAGTVSNEETKPEEKVEEKPSQPEINFYKEDAEETSDAKTEKDIAPLITDDLLKNAEEARNTFYKGYKSKNTVKSVFSAGMIILMLAGWVLPGSLLGEDTGSLALIISIIVCAICLVGLGVYSHFFKKASDEGIKKYFASFYENSYKYAFSDVEVTDYVGNLDCKLSDEAFNACLLYKDVYKVGSRYFSTFSYKGSECSICDCAAQTKGAKSLQTIFVGKYLTVSNDYKGKGLYIYIKGNKRAIPPNNLSAFELVEDNKDYCIYGEKKSLTPAIRTALNKIKTNKTLVDVAISVQPGKTYFALGYEDNLMVIPLQSSLDPRPYEQFRNDIALFMGISDVFNAKKVEK